MILSPWQLIVSHLVYLARDVGCLALEIAVFRAVQGTRWSVHRHWLSLWIQENLIALVYRAIWDIHSFTGLHPPQAAYALGLTCLYAANVFGLCGTAVLCRTFRAMVRERAGLPHADPSPFPETGVWPPPPTPPV